MAYVSFTLLASYDNGPLGPYGAATGVYDVLSGGAPVTPGAPPLAGESDTRRTADMATAAVGARDRPSRGGVGKPAAGRDGTFA